MSEVDLSRTDQVMAQLKREAEEGGYHLNPDEDFTRMLVDGLLVNEQRYGYRACPCRLASGDAARDLDIVCPCDYRDDDISEFGACYCALYVSAEIARGEASAGSIPERRPPGGKVPASPPSSLLPSTLPYPVWRCAVCGYLCARKSPPSVCPICKVSKERFEKFLG
jgi:ferredoxin-thioredoxin reductase catalytic subunit/rubredoxin